MTPSQTLLVQYGRTAFVGVFASVEPILAKRGATVVVRTLRGLELGLALCEPNAGYANLAEAGGDFVRIASVDDEAEAEAIEVRRLLLLESAQQSFAAEPVVVLDAELLFDRTNAILHVMPWDECNLDDALEALSRDFGFTVKALDLNRLPTLVEPAPAKSSCGTGCGTKEGGCSSGGCGTKAEGETSGCGSGGSCSRSQVKSADDLTNYFADLREKMEADTAGRKNLV